MNEENDPEITVWITKYALTVGIECVQAHVCKDVSTSMIVYTNGTYSNYAHGKDWHRTKDEAIYRAEMMKEAKIASLKKKIANLEKMQFI